MLLRRVAIPLLAALLGCAGGGGGEPVVVFAAASLRDVAGDLGAAFERRHGTKVVLNLAGSNTLAQQIRAAPRADVFLSADRGWVDFLAAHGRAEPDTRRAVLANRLVAIRHRDSALRLDGPQGLRAAPFRRLAIADPAAVPAGRYARAYLERSGDGVWPAVAARVVPALDVRAALALVASDPDTLGIVYRTDVAASDRVRVLFEFAPRDDLPVVYWAIAVRGGANPQGGRRFLDDLGRPEALAIARRHGFSPPPRSAPATAGPAAVTAGG